MVDNNKWLDDFISEMRARRSSYDGIIHEAAKVRQRASDSNRPVTDPDRLYLEQLRKLENI